MSLSEFELIDRYFNSVFSQGLSPGISLGIGDDAAVISPRAGQQGCICTDVLVAMFISQRLLIPLILHNVPCELTLVISPPWAPLQFVLLWA
jgi:hypothetical protein